MNTRRGAVIVELEPSVGELWTDAGGPHEILIWPRHRSIVDRLIARGHSVTLLVRSDLDEVALASLRGRLAPLQVLAGASLEVALGSQKRRRPSRTVFVSGDRSSRATAGDRFGLGLAPHIEAAEWVLDELQLRFAQILCRRRPDEKTPGLLPYYVEWTGAAWLVLGIVTEEQILRSVQAGSTLEVLPFDFRTNDCCLLRIDAPTAARAGDWPAGSLLAAGPGRVLVELRGSATPGPVPAHVAHGAWEMLLPAPELLAAPEQTEPHEARTEALASSLTRSAPDLAEAPAVEALADVPLAPLPDPGNFQADADRYSGRRALGDGRVIVSRHINHPDNVGAVDEILREMSSLGYCTFTHSFVHNGRSLRSAIADMPGRGFLRLRPDVYRRLLEILKGCPRPWVWAVIEEALVREFGARVIQEWKRLAEGPLRLRLEELVGAHPYQPWQRHRDAYVGLGAQLVIVGCHMDSSAERAPGGYDPAVDPAPGMDDDASGIAGCLAVARYLRAFRGQLRHTVRICFFNAEEAGLLGSKAYSAFLKATHAPVKAAICLDMIGYDSDKNGIFEIHAGFTDPSVRDSNVPIAERVRSWASTLGGPGSAQIYQGTSPSAGAPDRSLCDPAINRSDHAAFHQQGFRAVAVTEDYFANLPSEPGKDPNPNYHSPGDTVIDAGYGAAIAAAVACATKELAGG